jgi:uncharacterized protein YgiM (DUF1202 family)
MLKSYIIVLTVLIAITFAGNSPGAHASAASSMVEIKAAALNVRTGPGTEHDILNMVPRGTYITLMARQGDWLRVKLPWGSTDGSSEERNMLPPTPSKKPFRPRQTP